MLRAGNLPVGRRVASVIVLATVRLLTVVGRVRILYGAVSVDAGRVVDLLTEVAQEIGDDGGHGHGEERARDAALCVRRTRSSHKDPYAYTLRADIRGLLDELQDPETEAQRMLADLLAEPASLAVASPTELRRDNHKRGVHSGAGRRDQPR